VDEGVVGSQRKGQHLSYPKSTRDEEVLHCVQESPANPEFYEPEQDQAKAAQEDQVGQTADSSRWEEVEVGFLMVESHQEDAKEDQKDDTDKPCEEGWGVDSLSWCFGHNDGGDGIVKLI